MRRFSVEKERTNAFSSYLYSNEYNSINNIIISLSKDIMFVSVRNNK